MVRGVQLGKEFGYLSGANSIHERLREVYAQKALLEWSPEAVTTENQRLEGINELLIKHRYDDLDQLSPTSFFNLSNLDLTRIPRKLVEFLNKVQLTWQIKSISFANNHLTTLPEEIFSFGYLTTVDISNNPLDEKQRNEISQKYPHITFVREHAFVDVPLNDEPPRLVTPGFNQSRQQRGTNRINGQTPQPTKDSRKESCLLV